MFRNRAPADRSPFLLICEKHVETACCLLGFPFGPDLSLCPSSLLHTNSTVYDMYHMFVLDSLQEINIHFHSVLIWER